MLKHVVKHNSRKAALLYRQVPGEDHMCLLVYSDLLPRMIHDEIMKVLESPVGQQASDLADALFRNIMPDGKNTLQVLHVEGMIQKVPCNQVIVQANQKSSVRLDELNDILNEMAKGQEAVQRLADLDAKVTGWTPAQQQEQNAKNAAKKKAKMEEGREVGVPPNAAKPVDVPVVESVLTNADLAQNLLAQAERMKQQAVSMLSEVERLTKEAVALVPQPAVKVTRKNVAKTKVKAH
jgi:hypothetical protein